MALSMANPLVRAGIGYAGSSLYNSFLPTGTPDSAKLDPGMTALAAGLLPKDVAMRAAAGGAGIAAYNAFMPGYDINPGVGMAAATAAPALYRAWRNSSNGSSFLNEIEQEGRKTLASQRQRGQGFLDDVLAGIDGVVNKQKAQGSTPDLPSPSVAIQDPWLTPDAGVKSREEKIRNHYSRVTDEIIRETAPIPEVAKAEEKASVFLDKTISQSLATPPPQEAKKEEITRRLLEAAIPVPGISQKNAKARDYAIRTIDTVAQTIKPQALREKPKSKAPVFRLNNNPFNYLQRAVENGDRIGDPIFKDASTYLTGVLSSLIVGSGKANQLFSGPIQGLASSISGRIRELQEPALYRSSPNTPKTRSVIESPIPQPAPKTTPPQQYLDNILDSVTDSMLPSPNERPKAAQEPSKGFGQIRVVQQPKQSQDKQNKRRKEV